MSKFDDERPPQEMAPLVEGIFHKRRREPALKVNRLRQHWPEIVGEALARVTRPTRIARGVLWITAVDTGWAFNLQFVKADLLSAVRTFLDSEEVREIRFKAGPLPEEPAPAPPPDPARPEAAPHSEPSSAPAAARAGEPAAPDTAPSAPAPIADARLRARFDSLAAKLRAKRKPLDD